ncbi:MAG TPA: ferritin family protein, partial [Candidatus Krumholzibacteria bacterium]
MAAESAPKKSPDRADIRRFQANLDDEIDGIAIYRMLADTEKDPERVRIFRELAGVEERHADVWRKKLREAGAEPREHGPSLKVRLLTVAARTLGVRSVLPIIRSMEAGAYGAYMAQDETAQALAIEEREHRVTMSRMMRGGQEPSEVILQRERWHRSAHSGTL